MLNSSVRLALLTSVTCRLPPVSRQIRNESTVPNRISPRSARARRPGMRVEQVLDLGAREVGVEHQAGLAAEQRLEAVGLQPIADRRADAALPDDGVGDRLARCARSQRIVVSRWLVMPIAAMSRGRDARPWRSASRAVSSCDDQIASGSCSTCPGAGRSAGTPAARRDRRGRRGRRRSPGWRWCPGRGRGRSVGSRSVLQESAESGRAGARLHERRQTARPTTAPPTTQVGGAYHVPRSVVSAVLDISWSDAEADHERQQPEADQRQQDDAGKARRSAAGSATDSRRSARGADQRRERSARPRPPPAPAGAAAAGARRRAAAAGRR